MKIILCLVACIFFLQMVTCEEVRLLDLEPPDAQQVIEKQDQSLHYAPKVESNVPAVRYLGNEPHDVQEDIYLARQYHGQDGIGGYLYGYNIPDIAKTEKKIAGGDLRGAYNYKSLDGQEIKVEYWDDGTGFHQIDNVPKILPKQVDDSPEVKAEKDKFLARWHEEAERNLHPVTSPYDSEGNYASGPLSPQGQAQIKNQYGNQYPQGSYQQPGVYQPSSSQYQPAQNQVYGQYQPSEQSGTGSNQQNAYSQQPGQYQQNGQYQQSQPTSQPSQPGQYQQSGQYQQPGQFQQSGQNQQSGQYQQPNQYQQSGQHQQSGQYQQPSQYQQSAQPQQSGQYQQPGQYQSSQSQTSSQYQNPGQQAQGVQSENQIDYTGQYSENQNSYSKPASQYNQNTNGQYVQQNQVQPGQYKQSEHSNSNQDSGEYNKKYDEEENGPPKGFFYSFDYPVGKIVSIGGIARSANVQNTYEANKASYESQLRSGRSSTGAAQSSYLLSQ